MKKKVPEVSEVITHLKKLPILKGHTILVTSINPKLPRALKKLEGVKAVESYLVTIIWDERKRQ